MSSRPIDHGRVRLGDTLLFDLDATAGALNLSTKSVRRLFREGELASILHGGRHLVAEAEINDYVARQISAGVKRRATRARAHRNEGQAVREP